MFRFYSKPFLLICALYALLLCSCDSDKTEVTEYIQARFNGKPWKAINHQVVVDLDSNRLMIRGTSEKLSVITGVYLNIKKPLELKSYPLDFNTDNYGAYMRGDANHLSMSFSCNNTDSLTFTYIDSVYAEGTFHFSVNFKNTEEINVTQGLFHIFFDPLRN